MLLSFLPLLLLSVVGAVVLGAVKRSFASSAASAPVALEVRKKRYFFSQAERLFFVALSDATRGAPVTVLSKVKLNDIMETTGEHKRANNNRIDRMHVDFLLLSQPDFQPILGIELDGSSHQSERQQTRDGKKDAAFKAAGLPLVRLPNGVQPAQLRQAIEPYLQG